MFVAGLLRKQEGGRGAFSGVKKPLRLLVEDVNDMAPSDIAYTFSGYAPLGIRLVEVRLTGAWPTAEITSTQYPKILTLEL